MAGLLPKRFLYHQSKPDYRGYQDLTSNITMLAHVQRSDSLVLGMLNACKSNPHFQGYPLRYLGIKPFLDCLQKRPISCTGTATRSKPPSDTSRKPTRTTNRSLVGCPDPTNRMRNLLLHRSARKLPSQTLMCLSRTLVCLFNSFSNIRALLVSQNA